MLDDRPPVAAARPADLNARDVLRATRDLYRRRFARVATVAAVTFGVLGTLRAFATVVFAGEHHRVLLLALALTASGLATFGSTFFAGFLDEEVGGELRGEPSPSLRAILHDLPWARLLVADLVLTLVVTVLALGLVVPGLVALTLFAVVGPIVNIERQSVRASFVRSLRLVQPHFSLVFLVVTVPLFAEHQVLHAVGALVLDGSFPAVWVAHAVAGATVGSVVGLVEVVLAYALLHHAPTTESARAGLSTGPRRAPRTG